MLVNNTNRLTTVQLLKLALAITEIIPSKEYRRVYKEYNKNSLRVKIYAMDPDTMRKHKELLDAVLNQLGFTFISEFVPSYETWIYYPWSLKILIVAVK